MAPALIMLPTPPVLNGPAYSLALCACRLQDAMAASLAAKESLLGHTAASGYAYPIFILDQLLLCNQVSFTMQMQSDLCTQQKLGCMACCLLPILLAQPQLGSNVQPSAANV